MITDSREISCQVGQTLPRSDGGRSRIAVSPIDAWIQLLKSSKALRAHACEVCAETRNQRQVAVLRRAIRQVSADRYGEHGCQANDEGDAAHCSHGNRPPPRLGFSVR